MDIEGTGIAPWNINDLQITKANEGLLINSKPLIFYHFHHYRTVNSYFVHHGLSIYLVSKFKRDVVRKLIYEKYFNEIKLIKSRISNQISDGAVRISTKGLWKELKINNLFLFIGSGSFEVNLYEYLGKINSFKNKILKSLGRNN